ncbi:MAG: hypothetical protein M2R45_03759 [Verrucomicrobia subdivision 3 bacterium]|nr:hypothetical protein [Limisphaerales bacterium]MCS1416917.1 hypothetical protein [Limisphaerales bacterium]
MAHGEVMAISVWIFKNKEGFLNEAELEVAKEQERSIITQYWTTTERIGMPCRARF